MADQQPEGGGRIRFLFGSALVVGLLGAVGYLAGQLNAHAYYLVKEGRTLVVYRGAPVPFATRPFVAQNEAERIAYAPIPIGSHFDGTAKQRYADRAELDRAIFLLLEKRVREELYGSRNPRADRVEGEMKRIESLAGLSDDDRRAMSELAGDYAYLRARDLIEGLPERLNEAQRLCEQAHRLGSGKLGDPRPLEQQLATWQLLLRAPIAMPPSGSGAPATGPTSAPAVVPSVTAPALPGQGLPAEAPQSAPAAPNVERPAR